MADPFADLLSGEELSRESSETGSQYQNVNIEGGQCRNVINGRALEDKASGGLGENSGRKGGVSELTV